jgi:hypothetical protein
MNQELIDLIAAAVGGLMSLFFEFFPLVKGWFEGLSKFQKQAVFGVVAVVVSAGAFGLSCAGVWAMIFPTLVIYCSFAGAIDMLMVAISVMGGAAATNITITKLLKLVRGQ